MIKYSQFEDSDRQYKGDSHLPLLRIKCAHNPLPGMTIQDGYTKITGRIENKATKQKNSFFEKELRKLIKRFRRTIRARGAN